jgi:4-amino-4-deoxy-L-arabinose transferase
VSERLGVWALVLLGLVVAFSFQGSHGLFDPSEGRYAEVAREMIESGDFMHPTLDLRPHWTKPPMAYWAAAAGLDLFGPNAWGARLFNAVELVLTSLCVAAAGRLLWDRRTGFLAGLIYLSSPLPVLGAAFLTADTLLTMWETAAVLAFILSWRSSERGTARWWIRAMWFFFGLGFLTKGPPALLPLLPLIVFRAGLRNRPPLIDPIGLAIFLVSGFWWYAAVSIGTPGLLGYFLREEVVARNVSGEFDRNPQWWAPFAIYLPALLAALGIWLIGVVRGARAALRAAGDGRPGVWGPSGTPHRLLFLWLAIPLIVFSLSKSRLILYMLPLHAPLALSAAALIAPRTRTRAVAALALASVVLCIGLKASIPLVNRENNAKLLYEAAVAAGGADARYAFLGEDARYGVQFYFKGDIERLSVKGTESWALRSLRDVAVEATTESLGRFVIITNVSGARRVERMFGEVGIPLSVSQSYGHEIIVAGGYARNTPIRRAP